MDLFLQYLPQLCYSWLSKWKTNWRKKSNRYSDQRYTHYNYLSFALFWFHSIYFCFLTGCNMSNCLPYFSPVSIFVKSFSWLVYLYIQYLYIFYPDHIKEIPVSIIRLRSFLWKLFLTIISMVISTICPLENQPIMFQFLAKGKQYDRYTLYLMMITFYTKFVHIKETKKLKPPCPTLYNKKPCPNKCFVICDFYSILP